MLLDKMVAKSISQNISLGLGVATHMCVCNILFHYKYFDRRCYVIWKINIFNIGNQWYCCNVNRWYL